MQIRRFEAPDIAQGLMMVKKEFGPNAVVLSLRTLKAPKGLFNFFNRPKVEITAATDNGLSDTFARSLNHWRIDDSAKPYDPPANRSKPLRGFAAYEAGKADNKFFGVQKEKNKEEITDTRLHAVYQKMLEHDVDRAIALELIRSAQKNKNFAKEDYGNERLVASLREAGIKASPIALNRKKEVIAFVGPTGVGKTTSIFKLAAFHSLEKKKRVGIITLDSNRIGTIEQLKVFEKIIGVSTDVAFDPKEAAACLKKFKNCDLIFIDTPGINPRDDEGIKEINLFLTSILPTEIHLVLSATTKEKDLKDAIKKFSPLSIGKLLFTKIDESSTCGPIINQLYRTSIPVSYLADGQRIPEDIEPATIERLISLMTNQDEKEEENRKAAPHRMTDESEFVSDDRESVYVSNKRSQFFHHAGCSRVKKIHEKNIIVYKSQREANRKGLKPCKMCLKDDAFQNTTSTMIAGMR